jgi:hypothetical protein
MLRPAVTKTVVLQRVLLLLLLLLLPCRRIIAAINQAAAAKGQATHFKADFVGNDTKNGKPIYYGACAVSQLLCTASLFDRMLLTATLLSEALAVWYIITHSPARLPANSKELAK